MIQATRENHIAEILANMNHVFFTPDGATDFRNANREIGMPIGTVKFAPSMDMTFFERKCSENETFTTLPDDRELMRIIREIPGFERA